MDRTRDLWLINNIASGSNDADALLAFESHCEQCGLRVAHRTTFPAQDLPNPAMLDAAGLDLVAIFAGDGTINTALDALRGWGGAVLVLPGGTMNLLYHRLFGDLPVEEALRAAAEGQTVRRRPGIIRVGDRRAYAGLLAGPGTSWNGVREAMRDKDLVEMAAGAREALAETLNAPPVLCREPELGRRTGYPLLLLDPHDTAFDITAYHAENAGEYLEQTWALMRRDFREGPHDLLGQADKVVLASAQGDAIGVLLDGEPADFSGPTEFVLARCEVDLLATVDDGR